MRRTLFLVLSVYLLSHLNIYSQKSATTFEINYTLGISDVEGYGAVSIESNSIFKYMLKVDGTEFSYSIPMKNIARGEVVSSYGDYYVSLWCDDEEYYCVESIINDNGKRTQTYDRILNINVGTREEGESILEDISLISDRYVGNDFNNANAPIIPDREVFICDSNNAYAYHSTTSCNGLGNCEYSVYRVSEIGARDEGYRYCEICWE